MARTSTPESNGPHPPRGLSRDRRWPCSPASSPSQLGGRWARPDRLPAPVAPRLGPTLPRSGWPGGPPPRGQSRERLQGPAVPPPLRSPPSSTCLARQGMNVIRLLFIWEAFEPTPGVITPPISCPRAIAEAAWAHGLYVIIDVHQDGFSRRLARAAAADSLPGRLRPAPDRGPPITAATARTWVFHESPTRTSTAPSPTSTPTPTASGPATSPCSIGSPPRSRRSPA